MTGPLPEFRSNSDYTANDTSGMANVPWFSLLTMVTISATLSFMAEAQDCFGGIETFEKMVSMGFTGVVSYKSMLQQPGQAITRDCVNLCKQQAACLSFTLNYTSSSCVSYNVNSVGRGDDIVRTKAVNFFEKICFRGVTKAVFDAACRDRLWVFDRVHDAYLDGHVDKETKNVRTKEDCEKLCITEERFKCRSADYDEVQRICRMSRETRRTKPNAFKVEPGSGRNYLENQCAPPPPASCRYEPQQDHTLLTPDYLQFAASATDCMDQCDAETAFNCWSYSFVDNRCQLSSDSSVTWGKDVALPVHAGAVYGEMKCFFEQCDNGVMTFEKMTGVLLRSAQGTMMKVDKPGALGNTQECAQICLEDGTECPAFSDHYHNMRCDRLDRNSNGRTQELIARDGENYFEKICLQGPEAQACSDKAWAFERALGYELADPLYRKTVPKVETRTSCIQLCLSEREFVCRSARYDEDSGQCKLSPADRRTDPMKYYRSEDARVSYLENSCLPVDTTCPYVETEDAYPTYANIIQTEGVSTLESCRELCTELQTFSCRSFSYYSSALQCFLSGDDKASGGSAAIQRRPGIVYYERMCALPSTDAETTPVETTPTLGISTQPQFQETEETTTKTTRPPYQPQEPSRPECAPSERLIFEKLTGFEPFGVTSTLLFRGDSSTPGITSECVRRCQTLNDCRSFLLDHQRFECSSVREPNGIYPADFRSSIGKTYFGGICVPAYVGCSKLWVFERVTDHELQGLSPLDVVRVVSLEQCQQHCLETRKYVCRSANYFHLRRECHVYGDDRTAARARLVTASRVDFFENQCLVETSFCPYQKSEENQAMVYVAKSVTDIPSTLHCERECNREREFNCRSYTYWDQGARGSICMLSGESRLTDQSAGIAYRESATYSEKNCKVGVTTDRGHGTTAYQPNTETTKTETHPTRTTSTLPYHPFPPPPPPPPPYKPPGHVPLPMPHMPPPICSTSQYTYEKVIGHDVRGGRRERIPTRVPIGVVQPCQAECQRLGEICQGFVVQYKSYQNCYVILRDPTDDAILIPSLDSVYFNKVCLRERPCQKIWSFERHIHHELHSEPIRETSEVLERADCEDLCLRERPSCKSAVYNYHDRTCRMYSETKRSAANRFLYSNEEVEYLESQCTSESPTCQYRDFPDRFLPQIDRLTRAFNLKDCQRQCDSEREFVCRSVNFETVARDCALSGQDVAGAPQGVSALQNRRNSLYSEKGNCEQVSVQCNPQDMLLTIHFDSPFHGRVYAKGNPSQCFVVGTGQSSLQFAISMGSRCGTVAENSDQFANEVVVQQHPVIMTDHDKTIKVICSFETQERTYTMAGPGVGAPGVDVARTYLKAPLTAVVTNTAPPPNVAMRVLDRSGRDARAVGLGEELTLKIELREVSSAFAIFARNLYARSTSGESLFLIDSSGCPTDATIFPALELDPTDHKSLLSTFKAFRFPSSGMVNFEVQIRFCQEKCEQVRCGGRDASFGRRKRELDSDLPVTFNISNTSSLDDEDVYFDRDSYDTVRAVVQDEPQSIVFPIELKDPSTDTQMHRDEAEESTEYHSTVKGYFNTDAMFNSKANAGFSSGGTSTTKSSTSADNSDVDTSIEDHAEHKKNATAGRDEDRNAMVKEHLMSESYKEENLYDITASTVAEFSPTEGNTKQSSTVTSFDGKESTAQGSVDGTASFGTPSYTSLMKTSPTERPEAPQQTTAESTTQSISDSRKTSFNRKFAFIHSEDNNSTGGYTTPMTNVHRKVNNDGNVTSEVYNRGSASSYQSQDIRDYGIQHSSNPVNGEQPYRGNDRLLFPRKDPFSASRNPYSSTPNKMANAEGTNKNDRADFRQSTGERIQPLPLNPQRLVDSANSPRTWNAPKQPIDVIPGHAHNRPPMQPHPIEIHEVPSPWDNKQNGGDPRYNPPPNAHYNIYNPRDDENRQSRVVTSSPNFPDRSKDIQMTNTWGMNPQSSSAVQLQRPLEILDHPNQRHGRPTAYQPPLPQSNQPRPIEIPSNQDRNQGNPYQSDMYPNNRYDYNRVHMQQPRPMELPNQPPNVPPLWNSNQNNANIPTTAPSHSNNKWGNSNTPQDHQRPPARGQNRPEEIRPPQRQPYPQPPPTMQNPQRPDDNKWRNNPQGNPPNQNSAPNANTNPVRNNYYGSPSQYRPSEVIATTQKTVPEEVPLSLAILVGEDGKSHNSANQKPKQQWRPPPQYNRGLQRHNIINTPRPEIADDDKVCTSRATVIATAVSVTLVYLGVVAGAVIGYRWHRKNKRRKAMSTNHQIHFPPNPTSANVTYASPDVTFRNVYGNFPVNSASTT